MLNLAVRNTRKLVRAKYSSENIRLGRNFTKKETAKLIATMVSLDTNKTAFTVLDPGAGTGILSSAIVEEICNRCKNCKQIFLTCYEDNKEFSAMLEYNLEKIRKKARHDFDVKLFYTIYRENYLTESCNHYTVTLDNVVEDKFDIIVCNPPVELVDKDSPEAESTGGFSQLKISSAYLFAKTAGKHLEENGRLMIILPTTVATASSLVDFRREMAEELCIDKMHLFIGKQKNASRAIPLKNEMILSYAKCEKPTSVIVSTSVDWGTPKNTTILPPLDYSFIVDESDGTLTLPKSVEDTNIVKYLSTLDDTIDTLGLKICTGLIIDSKCKDLIFNNGNKRGTIPLLRLKSMQGGRIDFPQESEGGYIAPINASLMQKNKNMIIIKRVPAKSDERYVNSAIYLASMIPKYQYISTHNKLNFIDTKSNTDEMSPRLVFGLFALLNSTIYDRYISIMSKSKQINAKEMRKIKFPPRNIIENMGMRLMDLRNLSVNACDQIVNPTLHIKMKS